VGCRAGCWGAVLGEDPVPAPQAGLGGDESFITDPGHLEQVPGADMTEALEPPSSAMWRNRSLVSLLVGQFVSLSGIQMTSVALPWFVLTSTHSPQKMTFVLLAQAIPFALFGLPAGAIVDRVDMKRLMVGLDLGRALVIGAIPLLAMLAKGDTLFWGIVALTALNATLATPYLSARSSIIPALVGSDVRDLTTANTALQFSLQITMVIGPMVAGVLIGVLGAPNVVLVDAVTYLFAAAVISMGVTYRRTGAPPSERHLIAEMRQGVAFVWDHRLIRLATFLGIVFMLGLAMLVDAALPVFVKQTLHAGPSALGWLLGVWGAGATVGMVVYGFAVRRWRLRRGVSLLGASSALSLAVWVPPLARALPASLVGLGAAGLADGPTGIMVTTLLQSEAPEEMRGRVFSAFHATVMAAGPVGLFVAGAVMERSGPLPVMFAVAAMFTAVTALAWLSPAARGA
jgi:MFS family permease